MKRLLVVGILAALVAGLLGGRAWWARRSRPAAAAKAVPPVGSIYKVADNLYIVPQGGGNTAVFVTSNGVVLVDTKMTANWNGLMDQVRSVTDKPLTHVINTHCHGDHAGGNLFIPEGVEIIAQENTAKEIKRLRNEFASGDDRGLPTKTFKDQLTLFDGSEAIDLYYFGAAHTGGDAFVVFRGARVMHAGDVFPNKIVPVINTNRGGDGVTYGETIRKAAAAIKGVDRVITGHGPVMSWADFENYGEFNLALLAHAKASIANGLDEEHAAANLKLPDKFNDYELDKAVAAFDQIYKGLGK